MGKRTDGSASDNRFVPRDYDRHVLACAVRASVYGPLLGVSSPFDVALVPTYEKTIRKRWCRRLGQLRDAGWPAVASPAAYWYRRNCMPYRLDTKANASCCGFYRLCPYCHQRQAVFGPYLALSGFLPKAQKDDLLLISCATAPSVRFSRGDTLLEELFVSRGEDRVFFSAVAGVTSHTIDLNGTDFGFVRRGVMFCPRADYPDVPGTTVQVREPTEEALLEFLPSAFPYPVSLAFAEGYADVATGAAVTMSIVTKLKNRRLASAFGGLSPITTKAANRKSSVASAD